MNEAALLEFQLGEVLDAIRITFSAIAFVVGVSVWTWAIYFMKETS